VALKAVSANRALTMSYQTRKPESEGHEGVDEVSVSADLTVVERTLDGDVVDVGICHGGHLSFLDGRNATFWMEYEYRDVLLVSKTINSSAAITSRFHYDLVEEKKTWGALTFQYPHLSHPRPSTFLSLPPPASLHSFSSKKTRTNSPATAVPRP
jgi:hypothetical protein